MNQAGQAETEGGAPPLPTAWKLPLKEASWPLTWKGKRMSSRERTVKESPEQRDSEEADELRKEIWREKEQGEMM